jgi:hypothetical protein
MKTAFFAYPSQPDDLVATIEAATQKANSKGNNSITAWPEMGVFGQSIPESVRSNIRAKDCFVFDVTRANLNVYYEAGFAIGSSKSIAPVINSSFANSISDLQRDGLFDNIGFKAYENSSQLADILDDLPTANLLDLYSKNLESEQPLFLLDCFKKTDFRNFIVSSIKSAKVHFRSFDPVEIPRLSTVFTISQITSSAGIILPILAEHIEDASRHNLRAAFIAGLGHGLERDTLLLEHRRFDRTAPADYREIITPVYDEKSISQIVEEFARNSLVASQSIKRRHSKAKKTELQRLTLGASAAENEFRTLSDYFVETAEFMKTVRGEVNVVAGRKGSGKTAIFFQTRDHFRERRDSHVTDLKPESHQLSYFREELLKLVDLGAFDHTLAAFWYFLLLSEILLTIKNDLEFAAKVDGRSLERIAEIEQYLDSFKIENSGDFTTRINRLSKVIIDEISSAKRRGQQISPEFLTNAIFRGGVNELKIFISRVATPGHKLIILFDNIDKGWPSNGVNEFDVRLVRLLIETLDKMKRDFAPLKREFMSVVFLRNDIYEMLVQGTPDRGKAGEVRIDWTDRIKLKQVIFKRLQASLGDKRSTATFNEIWSRFFKKNVGLTESFEFFVDHCLMRPRFLINIIENAISNAINRGHASVQEDDCIDAVRQHSLYLVDDFGYEIRDVSGLSADLLYSLVGAEQRMSRDEFISRFMDFGLTSDDATKAFELMLWYGVIGIIARDGLEKFIYDFDYNMKRLRAEERVVSGDPIYVTNAALHVALV